MKFNTKNFQLSNKDKEKGLVLPSKLSSELAYLSGVLAGDGNIFVRSDKKDYRIKCVGNPKDEKEFYRTVLSPLFKKLFNLKLDLKYQDSKKTFGFYIYSKCLVKFFNEILELPIGKKFNKLKIPKIVRDNGLINHFIRGLADTDFCITYKGERKHPTITGSSNSKSFIKEISKELKDLGFSFYEVYDYKLIDSRFKKGYSLINKIEISGKNNFNLWMKEINFSNPKHILKIRKI